MVDMRARSHSLPANCYEPGIYVCCICEEEFNIDPKVNLLFDSYDNDQYMGVVCPNCYTSWTEDEE